MDPATRLALRVNWRNLALGHESFDTDGATFVVDRAHPSIHDANFVVGATASTDAEIDRLIESAHTTYAHCPSLTFRLGPGAPAPLEARLATVGVERGAALVMLLDGALRGTAPQHDLQPIEDEAGWVLLRALKRLDWRDHAPRFGLGPDDVEVPDGLAACARLKSPPVTYFLAWADGAPVGFCHAWEGVDGVGQVEDLFVLPTYRRRGIATALIHRCAAHARARGAGPLALVADPAETPKAMYLAMGWRPVALCRQYGVTRTP